jgi:hypothetical protein
MAYSGLYSMEIVGLRLESSACALNSQPYIPSWEGQELPSQVSEALVVT